MDEYNITKPMVDSCQPSDITDNLSYAMAYVPMQRWNKVYDPDVGFARGTIFPCLDLPFLGKEVLK